MDRLVKPESDDRESIDHAAVSSSLGPQGEQKIVLQGNDASNTYPIFSRECDIISSKNSSEQRINASNKIKVSKLVNFEWEQRYTNGNLIAVHKSNQYFAYSIRLESNGKVRVFNRRLNEKTLLKSFKGRVVDLAFAHCDSQILLGCVDETGALQIFQLTLDADSKIHSNVVFHLAGLSPSSKQHPLGEQDFNRLNSLQHQSVSSQSSSPIPVSQSPSQTTTSSSSGGSSSSTTHRIIWCTFVPEPSQEQETSTSFDDASQVFVLCRKSRAHVFNLPILLRLYDCAKGPIDVEELQSGGHLCIDEHKSTILTASFSPDGTAIATACIDGEIGFFKISFSIDGVSTGLRSSSTSEGLSLMSKQTEEDDKESGSSRVRALNAPKCLKKWKPHENRPITALYFLDDHKSPSLDAQFWNFILTGTDFNRELKIWDCRNWECLQTLRFHSADPVTKSSTPLGGLPVFKTAIDLSSKYLVMSDIMRKCFLVLHLQTDFVNNKAECFAVSEFLLAYPALHFAIIETAKIRARKYNQLNNVNQSEVDSNSIGPSDDLSLASNAAAGASNGGEGSDDHQLVSTVRLYCIQTKQLQEMEIYLSGEQSENFYNLGASPPPPPIAIAPPIVSSSQASSLLSTSLTVTPGNITGPNLAASSSSSILQQLLSNPNLSGEGLIPQRQTQKPAINLGPRKSESSELISRDENTTSSLNFNNSLNVNDDSAIIHVVAPPVPPQNGQLGINTTPSNPATYLMTPDAFLNSPTTRKSIDLTMTSTNQNAESKPTQHHGSSTSRTSTSSLTNVTASVIGAGASQSGSQVKQHFGGKTRTRSSSSSSSSSTTSSSSSSSSNMDADDKEIANTLSKGRGINSNKNKVHETDLAKAESLLNKVRIEPIETITPRSAISGVEKENGTDNHSYHNQQQQQFMLTSKSFNMEVPPTASSNDDTGITVDMKNLLIQMTNALKSQHEEIENLKKHQITSQLQLKSQIDSTLKQLFVNQQQQLQQQQQQLAIMHQDLANVLRKDAAASRSTISANSSSDLDNRLAQVVRDEMGKMREKLVEPLRQQLARELAEQLKIVDTSVKEHLSKMFKSKSTLDLIAQSIGQSAQPTVVNSYRDAFQKILIPNFEKSCQSMYQQVNASFSKGTQDYLTEFEQHRRALDESREPISTEMKKVNGKVEHLEKHLTELGQNLSRIFAEQMRQNSAVMQDAIISSMKAIVKEEVHLAMRDQPDRLIALMRQSGTMTPVPMNSSGNSSGLLSQTPNKTQPTIADVKTQIQFFLSKNQYNSAFQVALCAADLELLTNLCEQCQPASVFEVTVNAATKKPQCQLAQPVLLSLIQQLSQDLSNQLEIKLKYLEEAVYNLDPMSPLTREHTPQVIPQLVAKINHHLSSHPNDKFARPLRMLSLASQALLPKSSSSAAARQQQQTQHDNF